MGGKKLTAAVMATAALVFGWGSPAGAAGRCGDHPWCNTSLTPDQRAQLLLEALTPQERIGLLGGDELSGVAGGANQHTGTENGVPRVGLPPTYYSDGPVGPRQGESTGLPIPMALAATWSMDQAAKHANVAATEAKFKGNDVIYAPTINIMRTPLAGRTFEGYGEDPWLVSRLGVAWINSVQQTGLMANVKHYAANNQEGYLGPLANESRPNGPPVSGSLVGGRMSVSVEADERTMREIYLPHFEAAVKEANASSVMCSYNRFRGQYACENYHLLTEVLRNDWGFKGYVLADYGAAHSAADQLKNGLDFEPWPGMIYGPLNVTTTLATGGATQADVDRAVHRVLRTLFAYGFFDREAFKLDDAQIDKPAHAAAAREIEEEAITLLENRDQILPLDGKKLNRVAVIGADADEFKTGGGSANIKPFAFVTPRQSIEERGKAEGFEVAYDDATDQGRAVGVAREADVAILFASDYQTEFYDRYCLSLNCPSYRGDQEALIEKVSAANPNTVVVLETGGPVLTPWRDKPKAILEAWYPGAQGGPAISRVLFGDVDPGGRLPATFPLREDDLPTAGDPEKYPGVGEVVKYKEGVLVGYRWFDSKDLGVAYPFGYGRSYTTFSYSAPRVRGNAGGASAVVTVTNTGKRTGSEVPQLYLGLPEPNSSTVQPPRALKAFQKVTLKPGESKRVVLRTDRRGLSYYDETAGDWRLADGCYNVFVGRSSRDIEGAGSFRIGSGAACPKPAIPSGGRGGSTTCRRSSVRVTLKGLRKRDVRRVVVYVNGKKQRTLTGRRSKVGVRLPGKAGKSRVELRVTLSNGRVKTIKRTLNNCRGRSARGPQGR